MMNQREFMYQPARLRDAQLAGKMLFLGVSVRVFPGGTGAGIVD